MRSRIWVVAAVVLAIAGGVVWTQEVEGGSRRLAWQDVTARMGPVLWPKSVSRSFWRRRQVVRYLARTFPQGPPRVPPFDFARRRLILVAAGPRSSTGYGVRIVRITERRSTIDVLARETTPGLGSTAVPRLTSPYRLITIPATSKRVYVQWQGRP
ncbi:MAG TPA: protease complex subunit PrcB family protein, partial [Gaiellaceae bacterium]|nr:protease complex subunit PrcB family protein [Gaiellaceae bacterium]